MPSVEPTTGQRRRLHGWAFGALVLITTLALFARLTACAFTDWDDSDTVAANTWLNPPSWAAVRFYWTTIGEKTPGQLFTPVTYTAWTAAAWVSDLVKGRTPDADGIRLSPAVFHGLNVLLHAATAAVAYGLLVRLFGRRWPAVAGAMLFAVHPVQVEPVAWVSGTKDVLCGLFSLAALWAYLAATDQQSRAVSARGGRRPRLARQTSSEPTAPATQDAGTGPARPGHPLTRGRRRFLWLAATLLFLLAMLSKPTAIVVPVMAFAVDVLVVGRPRRRAARSLWPWVVLMIPCALWTRAAQPAPWAATPLWQRPLVAADAVAFYLGKIAWPAHLSLDYGHRPAAVFASGGVYWTWLIPVGVAGLLVWRDRRVGAAVIALFLLPLLPVLGLAPFDFQFYSTTADHYLYLPMFAVALLVTWSLSRMSPVQEWPSGVTATRWGCVVVLVVLAARSVVQMGTWQNSTTLFTHVLAINPNSFAACDQLGYAQVKAAKRAAGGRPIVPVGDPAYPAWRQGQERAMDWYRRALQIYDGYVPALTNIAINCQRLDRYDDERAALRQVVALQPVVPPGLRADPAGLANRLIAAGDPATAVSYLDGFLRADPANVPLVILRNRALAAMNVRQPPASPGSTRAKPGANG
jgi:hypothetical protein